MMEIIYDPIRAVSDDLLLEYTINGESITATIDGQIDVFDFSSMPDGEAKKVETNLLYNPIVSAKRTNGVLTVKLLKTCTLEEMQEGDSDG